MAMHFGALVREVLSISCGSDLREAGADTALPSLTDPEARRRFARNVERIFGVRLSEADLDHLTTVRDVLQCVRLRRWIERVEHEDTQHPRVFRLRRLPDGSAVPSFPEPPARAGARRP